MEEMWKTEPSLFRNETCRITSQRLLPRWVGLGVLAEEVLGGIPLGPGGLAVGFLGAAGLGLGAGLVVGRGSDGT